MNGRKDKDVNIDKKIDTGREERVYKDSYEPTTNELDDDNPPSEDSDSDSDSGGTENGHK